MSAYIIKNKLQEPSQIKKFNVAKSFIALLISNDMEGYPYIRWSIEE